MTVAQSSRLEGALFRLRYPLGAILLSLIGIDTLSVAWTVLSGQRSPVPIPVQITFQDEAQLLLALGTLALAYAASLQALSTRQAAVSAERARIANLRPLLSIRLVEPSGPLDLDRQRARSERQSGPLFTAEIKDLTQIQFVLTNMGPGNAVAVTVKGPYETLDSHGPWPKEEFIPQPPGPVVSKAGWVFPVVEKRAMQANESYEFTVPVALPFPDHTGVAAGTYEILARVDLVAECTDVEGNVQPPVVVSVRLAQLVPFSYQTPADVVAGRDPGTGLAYRWASRVSPA